MNIKQQSPKVMPVFKVSDSLKEKQGVADLRRMDTKIIVDLLEDAMERRMQPLDKKLIK